MSGGQSDLDALRVQAEEIKDEIKAKRKECRDTTMQQVSQKKFSCFVLKFLRFFFWTYDGKFTLSTDSTKLEGYWKLYLRVYRLYKLYW